MFGDLTGLALRVLTEAEVEDERAALEEQLTGRAWDRWAIASCEERRGHWWHLDIDPDEGVSFGCRHCPADADTLVPDGYELLTGTFAISPGYRLTLDMGDVIVNDRWKDRHRASWDESLGIMYGWKGPVTASIRVEKYGGHFEPEEYDVWIDLAAA